jgi:hypothetical protein
LGAVVPDLATDLETRELVEIERQVLTAHLERRIGSNALDMTRNVLSRYPNEISVLHGLRRRIPDLSPAGIAALQISQLPH